MLVVVIDAQVGNIWRLPLQRSIFNLIGGLISDINLTLDQGAVEINAGIADEPAQAETGQ